ncbi:MAG: patatin-like phospholipase family protein [Methylobacter sp.]|jgi:hypothetical protein|nr:patatin-like phospholipase family protein [Methylobacter sp.]
MLNTRKKLSFLILICLFTYGCVPLKVQTNAHNQTLEHIKSIEKQYLQRDPRMGLALSGGGTRSASFNIGLLNGLHDGKKLNDFDYISSVSGGSYAALWYFSKLYYLDLSNPTGQCANGQDSYFFKECYNAQENNEEEKEIEKLCNSKYCNQFVPHKIQSNDQTIESCFVVDLHNYPNGKDEDITHYRFQRHLKNNSVLLRDTSQFSNDFYNYL